MQPNKKKCIKCQLWQPTDSTYCSACGGYFFEDEEVTQVRGVKPAKTDISLIIKTAGIVIGLVMFAAFFFQIGKLAQPNSSPTVQSKPQGLLSSNSSAPSPTASVSPQIAIQTKSNTKTKTTPKNIETAALGNTVSNANATPIPRINQYPTSSTSRPTGSYPVGTPLPQTTSRQTSTTSRYYIRGPRGGCYYINGNGNKTYVDRSLCD